MKRWGGRQMIQKMVKSCVADTKFYHGDFLNIAQMRHKAEIIVYPMKIELTTQLKSFQRDKLGKPVEVPHTVLLLPLTSDVYHTQTDSLGLGKKSLIELYK